MENVKMNLVKQNEYKKALEKEDGYTLKDYKKMIRPSSEGIDPYHMINNIKQTFGADIEEMEAIR